MTRVTSRCIGTTLLFMLGTLIGLWIGTYGNGLTIKQFILVLFTSLVFYTTQKFSLTSIKLNR
jgi:hypothetical protein